MSDTYTGTQFGAKWSEDDEVMWFVSLGGLRSACRPGCQSPEYRRPIAVYMRDIITRITVESEGELDSEWIDRLTSSYLPDEEATS